MAVNGKVNFFLKETDAGAGWSETYYYSSVDLPNVLVKAIVLAKKRLACLPFSVALPYVRVADDAIQRDSLVYVPPAIYGALNQPDQQVDVPWNAILCRLSSGSLYRRQLYLRGAPDSLIVEPENLLGLPSFTTPFNAFLKELSTANWAIRCFDRGPANPVKPINQIAKLVTPVKINLPAHGWNTGDKVRISHSAYRPVNAAWPIAVVDADNFVLLNSTVAPPLDIFGSGTAHRLVVVYEPIDQAIPVRQTKRNTGRPFDLLRGRRKRAK